MIRGELRLAAVGAALLAVSLGLSALAPREFAERRQMLELPHCSLPATTIGPEDARGTAILFHGLAANRRTMRALAQTMAALELEAIAVDWPGHGDSRMPFAMAALDTCAVELVTTLEQLGALDPDRTVIVGHSTGGAAALRLADRFPVAATIAVSPGVTPLPRRIPPNLLVFTGAWDIPRLVRFAEEISAAAGDERFAAEDFAERRAFTHIRVPRATHSSLLLDWTVHGESTRWVIKTLEPDTFLPPAGQFTGSTEISIDLRTLFSGLPAQLAGLVGLLLLFPLAATLATRAARARASAPALAATPLGGTVLRWALAGVLAVLVLDNWVPLEFLGLYEGDWMASFVLLAGIALGGMLWRRPERAAVLGLGAGASGAEAGGTEVRPYTAHTVRAVVAAAVVGLAVMLAFGRWLDGQFYDAWLNAPRWGRFAAMLPFLLPYFLAEEMALGAPTDAWRTEARRYARFILLRGILSGLAVAGVFLFGGPVLAALLGPYLALGGLVQRLGSDALVRRTASPAAGAVFGAILAAWALAAALPLL